MKISIIKSLTCAEGFGNPSGHTLLATVLAISFVRFVKTKKRLCTILVTILVLAVALSRLWLGVHYLNQIIYGCLLGFGIAVIIRKMLQSVLRESFLEKQMSIYLPMVSDLRSDDEYHIDRSSRLAVLKQNLWELVICLFLGLILPITIYLFWLNKAIPPLEDKYWAK